MKITVISYSLTGNNEALAAKLASEFSAEHIKIVPVIPRTFGMIALDMLFNRVPKINPSVKHIAANNFIIFVAPVWMGKIASPLRSCFEELKKHQHQYAFVSISGGADGSNPKLESELEKKLGKKPAIVLDYHITDLLPSEPKPTRDDTSAYRLTEENTLAITSQTVQNIQERLAN